MPAPVRVEQSRAVPVRVERAYDVVAPVPLPRIFRRRYAVLPPIREVRDQTGGVWGTTIGQTRTIVLADRGTMREELVDVHRPHRFGYVLSHITGSMKPLVAHAEGEWRFDPAGTGTRVTWAWTLHPTSNLTAPLVGVLGRLWLGYARQALEEVEAVLVDA